MRPEEDSEFDGKSNRRKDNFVNTVVEKIEESCVLEDFSGLTEDQWNQISGECSCL